MEKLAELKEKLKELSPEELEELKAFLTTESEKTEETAESEETAEKEPSEKTEAEEKVADETTLAADESAATEPAPEEKPSDETAEVPAETEEAKVEETHAEEPKAETESVETEQQEPAPETPNEYDDIPAMQKMAPAGEDDAVDNGSIKADTGEDIPVDYEQIIEGQNAKIAALEAEIASYKAKVEGAFGYSAKATIPAKVNRLYDECNDVHIHQ